MRLVVFLIFLSLSIAGCANQNSPYRKLIADVTSQSGRSLPRPSKNFHPLKIIPFSSSRVFEAAVHTLDNDQVPILNEDKRDGRIVTDYVAGPSFSLVLGVLGSNSTRYKYLVIVRRHGHGSVLRVTAYVESSGDAVQSWRDVSESNKITVNNIQKALVEQIEKRLRGASHPLS